MRALLSVILCTSTLVAQTTWHVSATAPGPGSGTAASPFASIQAGISAAANGDTVLVHGGVYTELLDFLGKDITVTSVDGAAQTIVDGVLAGTVVTFGSGEGPLATLRGLTVRNGLGANGLHGDPTYGSPGTDGTVGGILCDGASPVIEDCVIRDNRGGHGGNGTTWCSMSFPNFCGGNDGGAAGTGGLLLRNSGALLRRCTFIDNTAGFGGHGAGGVGWHTGAQGGDGGDGAAGAVEVEASDVLIRECTFRGNIGGSGGSAGVGGQCGVFGELCPPATPGIGGSGAVQLADDGPSLTLDGCLIIGNTGESAGSLSWVPGAGGVLASLLHMRNCVVADSVGDGVITWGPSTIRSSTLYNNSNRGVVGYADIRNSIIWGQGVASIESGFAGTLPVGHSIIEGGYPGPAIIDQDPLLLDPSQQDYHLGPGSPAIDAGDNAAAAGLAVDFEGDPRVYHGTVDIGADESILFLVISQPGGAGQPVFLDNGNLNPGGEYFNLFSLVPCPGGPGTGPISGLCGGAGLQTMLDQLALPVGAAPFHFLAPGSAVTWGPYAVPPLTLDALCFRNDPPGSEVARVVRFTVQ